MTQAQGPQQKDPEKYEVITSVTVNGCTKVVVKITAKAIEDQGRSACIAMTSAKLRALAGKLPKEIIVSTADFANAQRPFTGKPSLRLHRSERGPAKSS
jgi:hypothetical protein